MDEKTKKAVEEYQCLGCVCGSGTECYEKIDLNLACVKHVAGTSSIGVGVFYLGMPTGFCRKGQGNEMKINIFPNFESLKSVWEYDKYNVPCWKHLDQNSNTLVRGLSPRVNEPFLHVVLGDHIDKIDCLEITESDLEGMD
ncbi:hypothetical protein KAR91_55655 [Candidatus Pacearchaeota archaeon]|nr:hypothetical protein [Candidatus Pacearchaeota archaeon]